MLQSAMGDNPARPVTVFYSYSHRDDKAREKLASHLALLKRSGLIADWSDRQIDAGQDWEAEINQKLENADVILLLVTENFIASDFCWGKELKRALERHDNGTAYVIPIILTPLYWQPAPFGKLQALPKDGKAIALWTPRNAGWKNVVEGIAKIAQALGAGQKLERAEAQPVAAVLPAPTVTSAAAVRTAQRVGGHPNRVIYDAENLSTLPGKRVRAEADPPGADEAVNEVFDALGQSYYFFWDVWERDSIDNQGMRLDATVHYSKNYNNAFWNGTQIIAGDGDGRVFRPLTGLDVIAKEFANGVIAKQSNLLYSEESGALFNALASILSCLVKQYTLGQSAAQADWLMGSGIWAPGVNGRAIHSLAAPGTAYDDPILGKDPQSSHMKDYVHTTKDNGGVHINSGIPGHAFYKTAIALGGPAWQPAGQTWYAALCDKRMKPHTTFHDFASLTVHCAVRLFGGKSEEVEAVRQGWDAVGVGTKAVPRSPKKASARPHRRR
jgi:Thermolysin metallopeptidase, alpha-helical domain/Thermolysin metallopeptidase, catalytic domain/TIR domain